MGKFKSQFRKFVTEVNGQNECSEKLVAIQSHNKLKNINKTIEYSMFDNDIDRYCY